MTTSATDEKPPEKTGKLRASREEKHTQSRHSNATTTPEMRLFIQQSDLSVSQLAKILNITEATVRKWRKRESIVDCPNTPHHLNTTLTPMEEYVVVGLRYQLKLPLDRLLKATQTFINPNVSRSGLARCLKRYGISRLDEFEAPQVPERYFNQLPVTQGSDIQTYTVNPETLAKALALPSTDGNTVVQVVSLTIPPQLTEQAPSSVLLGVDTASDWIYLDIYQDSNTQATNRYIAYALRHGPFHLRKLLVRNYHTFLARFPGAHGTPKTNAAGSPSKVTVSRSTRGDSL
ncbi:transcriptional regulator [Shewanella putrefaciens]|uniref:Transcriptional regulator n=1 Tax=Shewanella putrefaciens TaxID=24 RepID=A0ABX8XFJ5_SHEPU|nr:transcriptional regulator [Shewanella putrefaciens]QSE50605.1 transcriptional regulator [Shewanella putrefaciens]QYX74015.1 transcriptional regulator [Shewanella putrefaciens]